VDQGRERLVGTPAASAASGPSSIWSHQRYGVIGVITTRPADEEAKGRACGVEKIWSGVRSRIFDELLK